MKFRMLIFMILISLSCQKVEEVEAPENLISENKMVEVLTDLSIMNSAKNFNRRRLEQTGFNPEEFLYEKHNIDSLRLAQSTKFYAQNPANLERIYKKVQRKLEALKTDLEIIRQEEIRVQDSINAANGVEDSLVIGNDSIFPTDTIISVPQRRRADTILPVPEMRINPNLN